MRPAGVIGSDVRQPVLEQVNQLAEHSAAGQRLSVAAAVEDPEARTAGARELRSDRSVHGVAGDGALWRLGSVRHGPPKSPPARGPKLPAWKLGPPTGRRRGYSPRGEPHRFFAWGLDPTSARFLTSTSLKSANGHSRRFRACAWRPGSVRRPGRRALRRTSG